MNIKVLDQVITDKYSLYNGDCIDVLRGLPSNSIGFEIFSPPFSSLFTYSDSKRDMGNSHSDKEFYDHFKFAIGEFYRVLQPGRLCAVHCEQLLSYKWRDGKIGLKDFRGDLIREFQKEDFIYQTEVVIWKDPVVEMQRTKAMGLLYKQLKKDSSLCRVGLSDYLLIFRKDGINENPISHTEEQFPLDKWQEFASPVWKEVYNEVDIEFLEQAYEGVWFDIKQGNTLQRDSIRDNKDEKHMCPLQLDVISRALELWSNPNDIILSPFMGIGSEGYQTILQGRRFIGIELKESFYKQAVNNIRKAVQISQESRLFK